MATYNLISKFLQFKDCIRILNSMSETVLIGKEVL